MPKNTRRKQSKTSTLKSLISSPFFPVILCFCVLGVAFVFFRMKGVEQDYAYNEISRKLEKVEQESKELKAKKAKALSVNNLRKIANKFKLKEPDHNQIILIPSNEK